MKPDYKLFSQNRQLFPRQQGYSGGGLICGHLNRMKCSADINEYLKNRHNQINMITSLARAKRCFCKKQIVDKNVKNQNDQIKKIKMNIQENRKLIYAMENIQIVIPKDKRQI